MSSPGRAFMALTNFASITSLFSSPITFSLTYSDSSTLVFLLFLEYSRHAPSFGPQSLSLMPATFFFQKFTHSQTFTSFKDLLKCIFSRRPDNPFKTTTVLSPSVSQSRLLFIFFYSIFYSISNIPYNILIYYVYCLLFVSSARM